MEKISKTHTKILYNRRKHKLKVFENQLMFYILCLYINVNIIILL